jgi:ABC-type sugar transport system ATPase subunit
VSAISIKNVVKAYGKTQVVHGINLEIDHNEFVVLVGPSGCGKSTTLRMIAGLEDITGGDIFIGDQLVNDLPPRKRNISMVFQNYALYPHMNVRDNLGFGLKIAGQEPKLRWNNACRKRLKFSASPSFWTAGGAFRRSASARGHGPGHRPQSAGLPVRRAALQPRRQAAGADAHRDQEAASQGENDG